jgi:hypothetical protein
MHGEWLRIVKEATVIYVEVLSRHSSGQARVNMSKKYVKMAIGVSEILSG